MTLLVQSEHTVLQTGDWNKRETTSDMYPVLELANKMGQNVSLIFSELRKLKESISYTKGWS